MLSFLKDPNTRCLASKSRSVKTTPPTSGDREQPYIETNLQDVAILVATHHEVFVDYQVKNTLSKTDLFQRTIAFMNCFKELSSKRYKGLVFDLRLKKGSPRKFDTTIVLTQSVLQSYPFKFMFFESLRTILTTVINLPVTRQRAHTGYPQQRDFGNIFQSGWIDTPFNCSGFGRSYYDRGRISFT